MTTLITGGNNYGTHRCDARCYDAKHETCHCVCGGINHGQGITRAMQLTALKAELEIDRLCLAAGISPEAGRERLMQKGYLSLELGVDLAQSGASSDQRAASGGNAEQPGLAPRQGFGPIIEGMAKYKALAPPLCPECGEPAVKCLGPMTGQYEAEL